MYAKWLRRKRLELKYSQSFVASYLNVTREAVSRWERGKTRPTYECLRKLFQLYKCSDEEMLYFIKLSDYTLVEPQQESNFKR